MLKFSEYPCLKSSLRNAVAVSGSVLLLGVATGAAAQSTGWAETKARWNESGVDVGANYTSEDLYNLSGGRSSEFSHAGQLAIGAKFDLEKLWGWSGARLVVSVTNRDGDNINDEAGIGALLGPQEVHGRGHGPRLTQFWLDKDLFNDRVSLRIGRLNPGSDFGDFACNNMNLSNCGSAPGNLRGDYWYNWPISQWGAAVRVNLDDTKYVKVGAYEVNPDTLRMSFTKTLDLSGSIGTLTPIEFGWTPMLEGDLKGSYKVGAWYSSAGSRDVLTDSQGQLAAATGRNYALRSGSSGGYFTFVQQLTHGASSADQSGLRGFVNGIVTDEETAFVDRSITIGAVYKGIGNRDRDDVGLSFAVNHLNDRVSEDRAERLRLKQPSLAPGSNEFVTELYYSVHVTDNLMIRPDVQWIRRPGGIKQNDDAVIIGARTVVSF